MLADGVIVVDTFSVGFKESVVNEVFPVKMDGMPISDKRNIEKHISVEGEGARACLEDRRYGSSHGEHGGCKGIINKVEDILFILGRTSKEECF